MSLTSADRKIVAATASSQAGTTELFSRQGANKADAAISANEMPSCRASRSIGFERFHLAFAGTIACLKTEALPDGYTNFLVGRDAPETVFQKGKD